MDDKRLNQLKDMKLPPLSTAAREQIMLEAGQIFEQAFEQANPHAQTEDAVHKPEPKSQGKIFYARLKRHLTHIGDFDMKDYMIPAGAVASLCLVVTGAVIWSNLDDRKLGGTLAEVRTEVEADDAGQKPKAMATPKKIEKQITAKPAPQTARVNATKPANRLGNLQERVSKEAVRAKVKSHLPSELAMKPGTADKIYDEFVKKQAGKTQTYMHPSGSKRIESLAGQALTKRRHAAPAPGVIAPYPYPHPHDYPVQLPEQAGEKYHAKTPFSFTPAQQKPLSTFSIDVDTASYTLMRKSINAGHFPPKHSVRVEEYINYFTYDYKAPALEDKASTPFAVSANVYPSPWNAQTQIMHIGLQGAKADLAERPDANLVFLIDVSGSMQNRDKLPLLKQSMRLALTKLKPTDKVSIVTYAGYAGVALEPTPVSQRSKIEQVIDRLGAGGSTAGSEGILTAYHLAESNFIKGGINRIFLATDGDFNVGVHNRDGLKKLVEQKRKTGVSLSVLGFGRGNLNDSFMQVLAQNGNGVASYIDSYREAYKVLVSQAASALVPLAKDVKIQIEFNPDTVSEYRLIGYETRALKKEDFNNDRVDAGDINADHQVTAFYEIVPKGSNWRTVDGLRYAPAKKPVAALSGGNENELAFVKLRYKPIGSTTSKLVSLPIKKDQAFKDWASVPVDLKFATSVAGFAQILRGNKQMGRYDLDQVLEGAKAGQGTDKDGLRGEFIRLVDMARALRR